MASTCTTQNGLDQIQTPLLRMNVRIEGLDEKVDKFISRSADEAKAVMVELKKWNELIARFLQSDERTNLEASTKIHSTMQSSNDLDEFKKRQDNRNIKALPISKTGPFQSSGSSYGERGLKIADSVEEGPVSPDHVVIDIERLIEMEECQVAIGELSTHYGSKVNKGKEQLVPSLITDRAPEPEEKEEWKKLGDSQKRVCTLSNYIVQEGSVGTGHIVLDIPKLEREMHKPVSRSEEPKDEEDYQELMNEVLKVENLRMDEVNKEFLEIIYEKFKKDQHIAKRSLVKWLEGYVNPDEAWEAVRMISAKAIKLANKLSCLLVTLRFLLSETEELETQFQVLNSSLKYLCKDRDSVIPRRISSILNFAQKEVKHMKHMKTFNKEESRNDSGLKKGLLDSVQVDQLILQFLDEILRLESILTHHGQLDSKFLLKDLLSSRQTDLKEREKEVEGLELKLNELKELSGYPSGPKDMRLYRTVWSRINGYCNHVQVSEKRKTEWEIDASKLKQLVAKAARR